MEKGELIRNAHHWTQCLIAELSLLLCGNQLQN